MPERHNELHDTLARLHTELEAGGDVEPSLREELRATVREIEAVLESEGGAGSLGERLTELARRFESSHPRVAESVHRIVLGLAELGI